MELCHLITYSHLFVASLFYRVCVIHCCKEVSMCLKWFCIVGSYMYVFFFCHLGKLLLLCTMHNNSALPKFLCLLTTIKRCDLNFSVCEIFISFFFFLLFRQNLVESVTSDYLKKCIYDKHKDPLCPVFRLGYIVEQTGQKFSDIAYKVSVDTGGGWSLNESIYNLNT